MCQCMLNNYYPKITVVTPSYNQGQFIEETILSVIMQGYPNLEYIIMDGDSTDNTVEIIKKYEQYISFWQSAPDKGQGDAINQGFNRATGDILCWINSDDYFLPGTLNFVAQHLDCNAEQLLSGNCFHFKENSSFAYGSNVIGAQKNHKITDYDFYIQPSTFWTKKAWTKTGELNVDMHYCFDWEWLIRANECKIKTTYTTRYLSAYRLHEAHKSGSGSNKRILEIENIYKKHSKSDNLEILHYLLKKKNHITKTLALCERYGLQKIEHVIVKLLFPKLLKYPWPITANILYSLN